jgi:hypothetical protein
MNCTIAWTNTISCRCFSILVQSHVSIKAHHQLFGSSLTVLLQAENEPIFGFVTSDCVLAVWESSAMTCMIYLGTCVYIFSCVVYWHMLVTSLCTNRKKILGIMLPIEDASYHLVCAVGYGSNATICILKGARRGLLHGLGWFSEPQGLNTRPAWVEQL